LPASSTMFTCCCAFNKDDADTLQVDFSTTDEGADTRNSGATSFRAAPSPSSARHQMVTAEAAAPSRLLGHPLNLAVKAEASPKLPKLEKRPPPSSPAVEAPRQQAAELDRRGLEEQKARLQALVTEFVKKAVRGCSCTCLVEGDAGSVQRVAAKYYLDTPLRWLTVAPVEDGPGRARCPLGSLKDILHAGKDGRAFLGPEVMSVLGPGEAELLLALAFRGTAGPRSTVLLLMESTESRDAFLESLQVLSLYVQTQPEEPDD